MGDNAGEYKQAEEHPGRPAAAAIQLSGVHETLHVIAALLFLSYILFVEWNVT